MGNFNREDRGRDRGGYQSRGRSSFAPRGRSSFDRGGDRGGFQSRDREMFKAVCDNCGKDCEVPFRPTSGKPVYCSDCFEKMGGRNSDSARSERPQREFRPALMQVVDYKPQFAALNAKLDKILSLLEPKTVIFSAPEILEKVVEEKEIKTPKVKKAVKKTASK